MSVKDFVLKSVRGLRAFLRDDAEAAGLQATVEDTNKQHDILLSVVSRPENSQNKELHQQLNQVSLRGKQARERLEQLVRQKFPEFCAQQRYATIYRGVMEGTLNDETLTSVLTAWDSFQKGQISEAQGFNRGLDYVTRKCKLPSDFFNRMPEK